MAAVLLVVAVPFLLRFCAGFCRTLVQRVRGDRESSRKEAWSSLADCLLATTHACFMMRLAQTRVEAEQPSAAVETMSVWSPSSQFANRPLTQPRDAR